MFCGLADWQENQEVLDSWRHSLLFNTSRAILIQEVWNLTQIVLFQPGL